MFALKKLISSLLLPVPLVVALMAVGLAFLWFTRRQRTGRVLATVALAILFLSSIAVVTEPLVEHLEEMHPPVLLAEAPSPRDADARTARWIAVLGAGHSPAAGRPATGRLNDAAMARLGEGLRLHRLVPGTRMIFTGAAFSDSVSQGEITSRAAAELGVTPTEMIVDSGPRDTEEEAHAVASIVGRDRFILVTSASHLPRAVALFRKVGLDPIPSPADYHSGNPAGFQLVELYPNARSIDALDRALHEYLGLLWARLRGRI